MPRRTSKPARSIWLRPPRVPRANQGQAFTRDQVAGAALHLAVDGLDAVTMRAVAAELGITAMSLYWYVENRDQVVELMVDAVFARQAAPKGRTWRSLLRDLARTDRDRFAHHPWLAVSPDRRMRLPGPAQMAHYERVMAALLRVRPALSAGQVSMTIAIIDHFVAGYTIVEWPSALARHAEDDEVRAYLRGVVQDGEHPTMASFGGLFADFTKDRFDEELDRILDGLRPIFEPDG